MSFLKNNPSQMELYPIITGIFCGCLIVSNILASKTFSFYDFILPCGVVIFPIVYIVGDVLTEIYGFKLAKRAIYLGFVMSLIAVIAYQIAMFLPGTDAATSNAFNIVINYIFRHADNADINGKTASSPFTVTLPTSSSYTGTVTTPSVAGYTPYLLDDEHGTFEYGGHKYVYAGHYSFDKWSY